MPAVGEAARAHVTVEAPAALAAAAVVSMVATALERRRDFPSDAKEFGGRLSATVRHADDPAAWHREIEAVLQPYALPSDAVLAARSRELSLALSAVSWVSRVGRLTPGPAARNLVLGSLKCGALMAIAHGMMPDDAELRRAFASNGAAAKLRSDPKQAAKASIKARWEAWQSGSELHKNQAAFARAMCDSFDVIEAPATVEKWARAWAKERRATRGA